MKNFLSILIALSLTAGVLTSCASEEEKLAKAGCDCMGKEDKTEAQACIKKMGEDTPKLREDKEFGKKVRGMMKEKCPDAMERM